MTAPELRASRTRLATDMHIRNLPPETVARVKRAARVRSMTLAAYITALVRWHDDALAAGDLCKLWLTEFGLQRVEE